MTTVNMAVKEVIMAETVVYMMVNDGSADGAFAADTEDGAANSADDPAVALLFSPATTVPTNMDTVDTAVKEVIMAEMVVYTTANHGLADGAATADTGDDAAKLADNPSGALLLPLAKTVPTNGATLDMAVN